MWDACRPERLKPIAQRLGMDPEAISENVSSARTRFTSRTLQHSSHDVQCLLFDISYSVGGRDATLSCRSCTPVPPRLTPRKVRCFLAPWQNLLLFHLKPTDISRYRLLMCRRNEAESRRVTGRTLRNHGD